MGNGMGAGDEQDVSSKGKQGPNRIYSTLKSIDERLEIVVKLLGYISILIVTPLVFVLSYIGYDINSALGITEISELQRATSAELIAEGWSLDSDGALRALSQNSDRFDKFLLVGARPESDAAVLAIRALVLSSKSPPTSTEIFKAYIRSDQRFVDEVTENVATFNSFVTVALTNGFEAPEQLCAELKGFVQDGVFAFSLNGENNCERVASSGEIVAFLESLAVSLSNWASVVDGVSVVVISKEQQIKIAGAFSGSETNDEPQPFSYAAFLSSADGKVHRIRTAMKVLSPPAYWETKGAWSVALLEQGVEKRRGGYLPVVIVDVFGDWNVGIQKCYDILFGLGTSCDVEFSAVLIDGAMHVTEVKKVFAVSDGESDIPFLTGIDFALE